MKIQKITGSVINLNNFDYQKRNLKNNTVKTYNTNNLTFTGSKIDLVRKIFKPTINNIDEAMNSGMKKLNHSSEIALERLTPKLEPGDYTKLLVAKIQATDERIKALKDVLATQVKSAKVRNVEDDLNFYRNWDDAAQKKKYQTEAESAKKAQRDKYIWGFKWMSGGGTKYDEKMAPYWNGHWRYQRVESNLNDLRQIVADYNSSKDIQREILESLKRERASYLAQLTSARLGDFVNQTVNQHGSIKDRIAGYIDVKEQIKKDFVAPLLASKDNPNVSLPNAVVLYGATGVGKTEMLKGIEEECKDVAEIVHFPMNTSLDKFREEMHKLLEQAKNRFDKTKKRTILLIDEAEKYMCMSELKANRLATEFEADDFEILNKYGNKDKDNVDYLKSLLDWISEVPKEGETNKSKSATTLFITTNYPHLIDQDLMRRKGKFTPIAVHPAKDFNLEAVIKHYFKQNSDLLEQIKMLAPNDNFEEILNGQVKLSEKAKNVLLEKKNNGTISNMHIDYELSDWSNLERFIKFMNPSDKRGAYSNVEIKDMISKAFDRYLENPTKPMYKYFFDIKNETNRDITPARYSKFRTIYNMVTDKFDSEGFGQAEKEFTDLINAYQNGELNDEMCEAVEKQMAHIKEELQNLESKKKDGIALTEGEQMQYDLFKKWASIWE